MWWCLTPCGYWVTGERRRMAGLENGEPGFWKRMALRLADVDQYIRGDRWRPLVRWFYRRLAPFYDWGAAHLMPDYVEATKQLVEQVGAGEGDRLLDLGCGTGMVTVPAAARVAAAVGVDMTWGMLRQAQGKQAGLPLFLVRGDVRCLPFASSSFDAVTTSFMLLHLTADEKRRVFAESQRVLAAGGRLGLLTARERTTRAYPDPGEWRGWLEEAGFNSIIVSEWGDAYRLVLATAPGGRRAVSG